MRKTHILSMLAEDQPRVLTRITGLVARQGLNIETVTMGKTLRPGISRIILTISGHDSVFRRTEQQVNKIFDVMNVSGFTLERSIVKEICLIHVALQSGKEKTKLMHHVEAHKVNIVDFTPHSAILEITGSPREIEAFLTKIDHLDIQDISRSGVTAIMKQGSEEDDCTLNEKEE
ncbi:MAG: acetolactate synthase small subunit [Theionarchaea archaeon]|nr:acetolactate synthase small subunit [Theionarchaea archaeon]